MCCTVGFNDTGGDYGGMESLVKTEGTKGDEIYCDQPLHLHDIQILWSLHPTFHFQILQHLLREHGCVPKGDASSHAVSHQGALLPLQVL